MRLHLTTNDMDSRLRCGVKMLSEKIYDGTCFESMTIRVESRQWATTSYLSLGISRLYGGGLYGRGKITSRRFKCSRAAEHHTLGTHQMSDDASQSVVSEMVSSSVVTSYHKPSSLSSLSVIRVVLS